MLYTVCFVFQDETPNLIWSLFTIGSLCWICLLCDISSHYDNWSHSDIWSCYFIMTFGHATLAYFIITTGHCDIWSLCTTWSICDIWSRQLVSQRYLIMRHLATLLHDILYKWFWPCNIFGYFILTTVTVTGHATFWCKHYFIHLRHFVTLRQLVIQRHWLFHDIWSLHYLFPLWSMAPMWHYVLTATPDHATFDHHTTLHQHYYWQTVNICDIWLLYYDNWTCNIWSLCTTWSICNIQSR